MKNFKTWCPGCFKALSTKVRSNIINLIGSHDEMSVMAVVSHFRLKQPTISYHLSQLLKAGLLTSRSQGRQVFYRLNSSCPHDNQKCILR